VRRLPSSLPKSARATDPYYERRRLTAGGGFRRRADLRGKGGRPWVSSRRKEVR